MKNSISQQPEQHVLKQRSADELCLASPNLDTSIAIPDKRGSYSSLYDTLSRSGNNTSRWDTDHDFSSGSIFHRIDSTAPVVTSYAPADNSQDVAPDANIVITFSEKIIAGTGIIELHIDSPTGELLYSFDVETSNELFFSDNVLVINPTENLAEDTHYYLTIDPGTITDLAGNSFAGTEAYDFTTTTAGQDWDPVTGYGLLNIDAMLEMATEQVIDDAALFGDGYGEIDWGLNLIQAPDAWLAGYTGEGVVVAVIDTGINYLHPDLYENVWINQFEIAGNGIDDDQNGYVDDIYGFDFVNNDGYALDDNGHGTLVAGIIVGEPDDYGVTGVAYDASVMPIKVLDSDGSGTFSDVADGIYYAVNNGADIINLSLGAYDAISEELATALTFALDHDVIVSMAAGNDGLSYPTYPASLAITDGGIAVGAIDDTLSLASFSNEAGSTLPYDYLVAPGVDILSTIDLSYAVMSGTSLATPYVSGAAALLLSAEADFASDWTLEELEHILTSSADALDEALIASIAPEGIQETAIIGLPLTMEGNTEVFLA
ncbi:S8 family serine peptidase [Prosthecochloris sp. CIB 2401]|uniref:S8 family serine peptidase n=1 Tax=Prosthecochloris sp. CIB 2401 TaxID=1868325 RepID=UPI00080AB445|nr:S8 family serine peptidase [Prosthecochloris sp. CIB 2401]ANT65381.1 Thermophilic serine proteinase precursor [Prosthecochloris sp. CIB 2401]